jgi:hypothetical protein
MRISYAFKILEFTHPCDQDGIWELQKNGLTLVPEANMLSRYVAYIANGHGLPCVTPSTRPMIEYDHVLR